MKPLIFVLLLSGCATVAGKPVPIPQEHTEPVPPVQTVIQLQEGMNFTDLTNTTGDLIIAYGVCERRHTGLVQAFTTRDKIQAGE